MLILDLNLTTSPPLPYNGKNDGLANSYLTPHVSFHAKRAPVQSSIYTKTDGKLNALPETFLSIFKQKKLEHASFLSGASSLSIFAWLCITTQITEAITMLAIWDDLNNKRFLLHVECVLRSVVKLQHSH